MTLIIAFKCEEGVAIVSDTKLTDLQSGESSYDQKVFFPIIGAPFIVGAAGFRDLFREFNSKLPNIVNQRLAEYDLENVKALNASGYPFEEAVKYVQSSKPQPDASQSINTKSHKPKKIEQKLTLPLPYVYTYEHLMDDCKKIIKTISTPYLSRGYPLELIVAVKKGEGAPTLHQVDCQGFENQIDEYSAIGSGAPFARTFFSGQYDPKKSMLDLIGIAFLTIAYARDIAKENSVGYDDKHPPQAFAILNMGRLGEWEFKNQIDVLCSIEQEIANIDFKLKETCKKLKKLII
jgi:20S proteasome alpha/beta subunit